MTMPQRHSRRTTTTSGVVMVLVAWTGQAAGRGVQLPQALGIGMQGGGPAGQSGVGS